MRFPLAVLTVVACGFALAAPIPKEKDKPVKDEDAIQGVWKLDKFDAGDEKPPPDVFNITFTFKAGKLTNSKGDGPAREGEYKIDPTAKPKTIDLIHNQRVSPGIYELDGDTLKICLTEGGNAARPTEFKPAGMRTAVVTFKRVTDVKNEK